jgi:hypothetical protein
MYDVKFIIFVENDVDWSIRRCLESLEYNVWNLWIFLADCLNRMWIQEEPHGAYYVLGGDQQSTFNGSYFKKIKFEEFLNWQTFALE